MLFIWADGQREEDNVCPTCYLLLAKIYPDCSVNMIIMSAYCEARYIVQYKGHTFKDEQ